MQDEYEIAIEGRTTHLKTYHFWMNMYAIINGALFVGLYNTLNSDYKLVRFSIMVLGCLAGWFWFLSVCGFHAWIISWIKNIQRLENEQGKIYGAYLNSENLRPFSTPKLTKFFTLGVALVWSVMTLLQALNMANMQTPPCISFKSYIPIIVVILLALYIVIAFHNCRESDLSKTHTIKE